MPASSNDGGIDLDPVEVRDDLVRVTRELKLRGAGLVVTLRISPADDTPVKFRVTDTLATCFDIEDLGFHPAFEPSAGKITAEETAIEGVVEPGYAREIVWGICPTRPKPPADVRHLHETVNPTIAHAERWDGEADGQIPYGETSSSGEAERTPDRGFVTSVFAKLKRRLWGEPSAPQLESGAAESTADSERDESELRRVEALDHLDDVFMNLEAAKAETPSSASQSSNASAVDWDEFWGESTTQAAGSGRNGRPGGLSDGTGDTTEGNFEPQAHADVDVWPNLEFDSETIRKADGEYRTFAGLFDGIETETTDWKSNGTDSTELDVATQLIERLDDGWPLEKRRQLAEELLDETARERLQAASLDDRLQVLEAQLDEFPDINEVVAATIDIHRSAEADLGELTNELEDLELARRRVRSRIERATSERESIREHVDAIGDRTKQLESTLDRLENQERALRSRNERTFSGYKTEISRMESVGEAVDAMESEVRSQRESLVE